jgi:D-alanyl-D-alanine carboxypeptidase/D-alanyl-D-alanine-endopeptidase (penicillin-binding protein 4)
MLAFGPSIAQDKKPPASLPELRQRLQKHIGQARFAQALWGIKIVSLDSGKTVFEHNSQTLFSPASNCKLYTVALALDQLGGDFRIKTSLYAQARPDTSGRLEGDLVVYGRGDPTITARLHHGNIEEALELLVSVLTNCGVKHISGDLVGDATYFHGPPLGSGWAWDDLEYNYGAQISALTINDNLVQVSVSPGAHPGEPCQVKFSPDIDLVISNQTVTTEKAHTRDIKFYRPWSSKGLYVLGRMSVGDQGYTEQVPVPDPAYMFVVLFREALAHHGITVDGQVHSTDWPELESEPNRVNHMVELGSIDSLSLAAITREVQKPSQNLYADVLLAVVGELSRSPGEPTESTSEELGIDQLNKFLAKAGISKEEAWFEEGSGLSRDNLITPNATIALLRFMSRHPCGQIYLDALPIAGVDGTLRNRMVGTPAARKVRAKTGSLRWANSLSGHVTTAAGERLIFSIMLNRYQNLDVSHPARADIDAIPILLAGFTGRTADN